MKKKKKTPQPLRPSPVTMQLSEASLRKVAMRHGVPVEEVRKQMNLAMLNSLVNGKLDDVPRKEDIPTPEELISYGVEEVIRKRRE